MRSPWSEGSTKGVIASLTAETLYSVRKQGILHRFELVLKLGWFFA